MRCSSSWGVGEAVNPCIATYLLFACEKILNFPRLLVVFVLTSGQSLPMFTNVRRRQPVRRAGYVSIRTQPFILAYVEIVKVKLRVVFVSAKSFTRPMRSPFLPRFLVESRSLDPNRTRKWLNFLRSPLAIFAPLFIVSAQWRWAA